MTVDLVFLTKKEEEWRPTDALIAALKLAYPVIDIDQEVLRAWLWCQTNVSQRKTLIGMPRFLRAWVSRQNDKHHARVNLANVQMRPGLYQPRRRVLNS